ncbi:MAG: hypothetical protein QM714_10890 [Nocardioides sp.]|uniref:hypothetical protein n=1 Tax=Nocardioides sp. TaxID=35761 RepID=UPI0039E2C441
MGVLKDRDDSAPAQLRAGRFNRHTFWCGQSGSGETYAPGVVLEQLLIETRMSACTCDGSTSTCPPKAAALRLDPVQDPVDYHALLHVVDSAQGDATKLVESLQGEVLFAGGFIAEPSIVQVGARLTEEGGSDVKVPLD